MYSCDPKKFREWHEARIRELYPPTVVMELNQDREDFMFRAKWVCCKGG